MRRREVRCCPTCSRAARRIFRAVAIGRILQQVDQVFGFALGGVIVAIVSPRGALAIDAVTFVVSFLITAREVRERPAVLAGERPTVTSLVREIGPTVAVVLASRSRRALLWLSGGALLFLIAPESLAVAYAREHGHGAVAAGMLTAAQPLGIAVGAWALHQVLCPLAIRAAGCCHLPGVARSCSR